MRLAGRPTSAGGVRAGLDGTLLTPSDSQLCWYFVHPWIDALCAGGLSIVAFAVAIASPWSYVGGAFPSAIMAAGLLQWIINWPHFSATTYRLLRVPETRREFPLTTYVIPLVVGAGIVASLHWPTLVAPYFVKFFMLWSGYHFTAQSLGLCLLYARRAGYAISTRERRGLAAFLYGTFLVAACSTDMSTSPQSYYGVTYPGLGLPWQLMIALSIVMYAGGYFFARSVHDRYLRTGERLHIIVAIVASS